MKALISKFANRETVSYLIVGVLTTAVDYLVFAVVNEALKKIGMTLADPAVIATAVAWVAAVLFAYVTNKLAVFHSYAHSPAELLREIGTFFGARALSGLIVLVFMWVAVSRLHWNEYLSKLLSSAFNLVFNYAASKLFIFKK